MIIDKNIPVARLNNTIEVYLLTNLITDNHFPGEELQYNSGCLKTKVAFLKCIILKYLEW